GVRASHAEDHGPDVPGARPADVRPGARLAVRRGVAALRALLGSIRSPAVRAGVVQRELQRAPVDAGSAPRLKRGGVGAADADGVLLAAGDAERVVERDETVDVSRSGGDRPQVSADA